MSLLSYVLIEVTSGSGNEWFLHLLILVISFFPISIEIEGLCMPVILQYCAIEMKQLPWTQLYYVVSQWGKPLHVGWTVPGWKWPLSVNVSTLNNSYHPWILSSFSMISVFSLSPHRLTLTKISILGLRNYITPTSRGQVYQRPLVASHSFICLFWICANCAPYMNGICCITGENCVTGVVKYLGISLLIPYQPLSHGSVLFWMCP